MKPLITMIGVVVLSSQISYASSSDLLFNVSVNGTKLTFTPEKNHLYPEVEMLITSINYTFTDPSTQCENWQRADGYCKLSISQAKPAIVFISGSVGIMSFKLCTSFWGKRICQNYSINIKQDNCAASGGQFVVGSTACWIKTRISSPMQILRCSTACADAGLTLQQTGVSTLSPSLAGNVCSAFGYTDAPIKVSPNSITFIGNVENAGSASCVWDNLTGGDWDNPNNLDYSGLTGSYFCPCF